MKRIFTVFLAAVLVVLTSCGKNEGRLADGSFEFTDQNYPAINAAAQNIQYAVNAASAVLGIDTADAERFAVLCENNGEAYERLINGECDIIIAYGYGEETAALLDEKGIELEMTAVADDALVFICDAAGGVDSVTEEQLKAVYSGGIANFSELGGNDLALTAFNSGGGTAGRIAFDKYIAEGIEVIPDVTKGLETEHGAFTAPIEYDDRSGAFGYTMFSALPGFIGGVKALSVGGVAPCEDSLRSGAYPYLCPVYAVVRSGEEPDSPAMILYNWLCSEQGRELFNTKTPAEF